ncbi:Vomeronasal type-2 receptor 1 [Takifugu flavidus]|uniref:Vomeronasal type-2 receptor 1 n=1 Tax=Takifugu flavidus TaxID=433684 RepID=A0A5C6PEN1_9TELE|nr:Vomeronasal type-2 receptor 1 [Takifugu flavidus]
MTWKQVEEMIPVCLADSPVAAVIGLASSSPTGAAAHILGSFNIPLVSYFATCTCLSDKSTYPSFLRTVPSDLFQVRGLVQMVTFMSWLWVGTIGTTDDYSHYGIQAFSHQLRQQGGCVEFQLTIPKSPTAAELKEMADRLQSSTARVVVVFATEGQLLEFFLELIYRNMTGIQWVASEAWVTASLLTTPRFHALLEGTLGFSFPGAEIPGLKEFLLNICPSPKPGMEFVNMFWEDLFGCSTECQRCPEYYWPDKDKVKCLPGIEEFLSFSETMGIILVILTLVGVLLTFSLTIIFLHFRSTPIVKANNSEISFLLLLSLKLCFLCSLLFIGQPSLWKCRLRQAAFGISFVLCLSCLLVKTIVVLFAFRTNLRAGCCALKLFGPSRQRTLILCTTAPQVESL